jgi:hypothetical protein
MQSKEEVQHFYKNADRHKVEIVYRLLGIGCKTSITKQIQ